MVPMVVWKQHGPEPPSETQLDHMLAQLGRIADERLGAGVWSFDRIMRQIPDHFHAHARDPGWWSRSVRPTVIKYLGSKRRLVPALTLLARASGARTALDLFCGTTRVAQAWKRAGLTVTAVDSTRCAHVLARAYIETDPGADPGVVARTAAAVERLNRLPGSPGYVTATFCQQARYFRPENGARIDAIRQAIERDHAGTGCGRCSWPACWRRPTGSTRPPGCRWPTSSSGRHGPRRPRPAGARPGSRTGSSPPGGRLPVGRLADARIRRHRLSRPALQPAPLRRQLPRLGDAGGVGRTRPLRGRLQAPRPAGPAGPQPVQQPPGHARRAARGGGGGRRRGRRPLLQQRVVARLRRALQDMCADRGDAEVLAFDSPRYVGARIGIHNPAGQRVGRVSHLRNTEYLVLAGPRRRVRTMAATLTSAGLGRSPMPGSPGARLIHLTSGFAPASLTASAAPANVGGDHRLPRSVVGRAERVRTGDGNGCDGWPGGHRHRRRPWHRT